MDRLGTLLSWVMAIFLAFVAGAMLIVTNTPPHQFFRDAWSAANALYRKETFDNYDAQRAIMKCVYEGLTAKTIDAGLAVENRYLTSLLRGPQAANMIRTLFFSTQALGKGARRPPFAFLPAVSKVQARACT
jgi:hypothetical protein